jgi:phospholipid-transporting ATPase
LYSAGSGLTLYNEWLYQLFNVGFSSLPILIYALYDKEFERNELLTSPGHYQQSRKGCYFNFIVFWRWIAFAVVQGGVIFFIVIYALASNSTSYTGIIEDLYFTGSLIFTLVVLVINLTLLFSHNTITWASAVVCLGTLAMYYATYGILSVIQGQSIYGALGRLFIVPTHVFVQFAVIVIVLFIEMVMNRTRTLMYEHLQSLKTDAIQFKKDGEPSVPSKSKWRTMA